MPSIEDSFDDIAGMFPQGRTGAAARARIRAGFLAVLEEAREGGWQSDCREDRESCDTGADPCYYHELRARIEKLGKEG